LLCLAVSLATSSAGALELSKRDVPAVVGLDIQRKYVSNPVTRDRIRRKRDKTVSETLDNEVRFNLHQH
jgi:RNase P protein component